MNRLHPRVFADGLKLVENSFRNEDFVERLAQKREFADRSKVEKW
jgi:hypothetical protein